VLSAFGRRCVFEDGADLAHHWLREIETFFGTYKVLEELPTEIDGWDGREAAWEVIRAAWRRASG